MPELQDVMNTEEVDNADGYEEPSGTSSEQPEVLTHDQAINLLDSANIIVHSTGNCSDRNNPHCTSLDGVRRVTIEGIIAFQSDCGFEVTITGGTEVGHASGQFSHANGYKLDISRTDDVTNYIHDQFTFIGARSDGASQYQDAFGNIFAEEQNHWDITFK